VTFAIVPKNTTIYIFMRTPDARVEQGLQRGLILLKKNQLSNVFQAEEKSWQENPLFLG